jgi:hypothetical protein
MSEQFIEEIDDEEDEELEDRSNTAITGPANGTFIVV